MTFPTYFDNVKGFRTIVGYNFTPSGAIMPLFSMKESHEITALEPVEAYTWRPYVDVFAGVQLLSAEIIGTHNLD